jgi:dipeptidyl aminopeptidase/acylaminoacyl peptidase
MVTWTTFSDAAPAMAAAGRSLIYRTETGEALLATVRDGEPPRIHPIYVAILDGRLVAFILRSAKRVDLESDGRYALHTHQDPAAPSEFMIRGRARVAADPSERETAAAAWYFEVDDSYTLFEFSIESALLGERADADEWPPRYSSWRAEGG